MEYLNLYSLFTNYVFGSPEWAIFGVAAIIMAITYMGKWSPILRYVYVGGFIYASFHVIAGTPAVIIGILIGLPWMFMGLWRFVMAYRGQT